MIRNTSQIISLTSRSGYLASSRRFASGSNSVGDRVKGTDKVIGQDAPSNADVKPSDKVTEERVKDYNKGRQAEGSTVPGEFDRNKGGFVSPANVPEGTRKFSTSSNVKDAVKEGANYAKDVAKDAINSTTAANVKEKVKEGANYAKDVAKDAMSSTTASNAKDKVKEGASYVKEVAKDAMHSTTAKNVKDTVSDASTKAKDAFTGGSAKQAFNEVSNKAYNAKEDAKREVDRATSHASSQASGVMDAIKSGVATAAAAVPPMANKGYQVAKDAINSDTAQNIKEGVKETVKSAWDTVSGTVTGNAEVAKQKAKAHDPNMKPHLPNSVQPDTVESAEQKTKSEGKDSVRHTKL